MRRRVRRENVGVALFPFLAVLICTMGSLIVLLVLLVQQADVDAKAVVAEKALARQPSQAHLKQQREDWEDAQWRREILEKQRAEKQQELTDRRLELSHLEDHIRRLDEKAKMLMKLVAEVEAGNKSKDQDLALARAELDKLTTQIATKRRDLDAKKKQAAANEGWYALIPYDGPNGTRRMPIYVECVEEGIIIQPEGVLLTPDDFNGPLGPGNPLDAALRAKREYIVKNTVGKPLEPYPLLVVRPSGVVAYSAARAAMRAWDDEFGYELISEDKKLDFGTRDPNFDQVLQQTINQARKRQAILAAAMPKQFSHEEPLTSFSPDEVPGVNPESPTGGGRGIGRGGNGTGVGGSGGLASGGTGLPGGSPGTGRPGTGIGTGTGGSAAGGPAASIPDGPGSASGGTGGSGSGSTGPGNSSLAGSPGSQGNGGTASGNAKGTGPSGGNPGGASGGTPGGVKGGNSTQGTSTSSAGGGGAAGGTSAGGGSSSPGAFGSAGPPPDGAQGQPPNLAASMGNMNNGAGAPPSGSSTKKGKGRSATAGRGQNWGLPGAQGRLTAVTRPIRVACLSDRLVLLPERGEDRAPKEIRVSPEITTAEVDAFVDAVQKQMQSWGLAVADGFWKPTLHVEVARGAEERFNELQTALRGSGIDVQRKLR